ncbi:MAG: hypothetical protein AB7G93_09425 [Bdellovibrionales bacterium]
MNSHRPHNRIIAREVHAILKRYKPDAKLADAYEALARAHGYRSWNHASADDVRFDEDQIQRFVTAYIDKSEPMEVQDEKGS